jgi:hypothetical protein
MRNDEERNWTPLGLACLMNLRFKDGHSHIFFSPWCSFCEDGGAVFCVAFLVLSSS